jgi:colanic acid/amylovoran biosynthesis glycosyltransferase
MLVVEAFDTYLHATENWLYKLLKNLSGVDLIILSPNSENRSAFPLPRARFITPFTSVWRSSNPWLIRKIKNRIRLAINWIWKRLAIIRLRHADIIHAHFSVVAWDYLWFSRITVIPLVVSFYGFDYEYLPTVRPVWRKRYRTLFRDGSLFITEGHAGRKTLIAMGCPENKVKVVHLGVDTGTIPYHERVKRKNELHLVQIARFTDKKGHDTTVKAFAKARQTCPNMSLTLVGKDPEGIRARLEGFVADQNLGTSVRFMDSIDYAELYSFLKGFHVFIHPSRYGKHRDSEGGAPIVLLDAQATGMPVLSTFHCDIPDEVIHGKTGMLVAENGVDDLAAAIERFYAMDETEYREFSTRARSHVEQHYQASQCAHALKQAYASLLRDGSSDRIAHVHEGSQ